MAKDDYKIYNNKNGYYTEEELLKLKQMSNEEYYSFINAGFKNDTWKCPPLKFKTMDCFHCIQCIRNAVSSVKEKKK